MHQSHRCCPERRPNWFCCQTSVGQTQYCLGEMQSVSSCLGSCRTRLWQFELSATVARAREAVIELVLQSATMSAAQVGPTHVQSARPQSHGHVPAAGQSCHRRALGTARHPADAGQPLLPLPRALFQELGWRATIPDGHHHSEPLQWMFPA